MLRPAERGWTGLNEKKQRDSRTVQAGAGEEEDDQEQEDVEEKLDRGWDDDSVSSSLSEPLLPSTPPESEDGSEHPTSKKPLAYGHCPICEETWANPTALPTGYVGCYLCLYRFVEREGVCPVTGSDLTSMGGVDSLRKVLV
jgi:hypothetical protein